ncbi:regucalcin [Biscogniauxia mediterranea]|nr:regucalcin [Biscogniauxia mediterranea]
MSAASAPTIQQWDVKEPYLNLHCGLGEGPYYEAATNSLRFVDIKKHRLHTVNLDQGPESVSTLQLDTPLGVTADIEGVDPREKLLIGAKYGIAVLDRKTGKYEYVTRFGEQDNERLRSNDGAVGPDGTFWQGTMTDFGYETQNEGQLYVFSGSSQPARSVRQPIAIPNSVGWSPDGRTMYFTSTLERTVFAWDYEAGDSGPRLSNERVFYRHEDSAGVANAGALPDGFRVDAEGNLWHAFYYGSCVLKISPAGEVVGRVNLPTRNVTCVQFVGTELFITTAGMEEGEGTAREVELSGAVFRVDVGARGLEPFAFKMG